MTTTTRNQLAAPIKELRKGLAIYKVRLSPYWRVRVWIPSQGKYIVRSTKESSRIEATVAAEELAASLLGLGKLDATPKSRTFETYADRFLEIQKRLVAQGRRHRGVQQGDEYTIGHKEWGLVAYFARRDVSTINSKDVISYIEWSQRNRKEQLSFSTINNRISCLRKILKIARDDGLIAEVPSTPKPPRRDNPRPFFKFHPLVPRARDEYQALLKAAKALGAEKRLIRGTPVTTELHDFIVFLTHSFLRPTESEAYALRHSDVTVAENPKRLILTVRKGKTGYRQINTLEACVSVYKRLAKKPHTPDDLLFLPAYLNRGTAKRIIQRQFNAAIELAGGSAFFSSSVKHTVYSLRHTAICMRTIVQFEPIMLMNGKHASSSFQMLVKVSGAALGQSNSKGNVRQHCGKETSAR